MIYLQGATEFVPVVEMEHSILGLSNTLYHSFKLEHWQFLPMERAFMDVLREDHRYIVNSEDEEFQKGMEMAKYFSASTLAEVYPVLSYLVNHDAEVKVGQYCCTIGTREISNYVVKVGEAECQPKDGKGVWREGIYRISSVRPPEMGEG